MNSSVFQNMSLCRLSVFRIYAKHIIIYWGRGGTVVKVLCYESVGRWFDSKWCHWDFSLT